MRNIDTALRAEPGIEVLTVRRRANVACAEYALGLMLALAKKLLGTANRLSAEQLLRAGTPACPQRLAVSAAARERQHARIPRWCTARAGEARCEKIGTATPARISGEFLRVASGIDLASVFYKGVAGAVVEVMGGQIDMAIVTISPMVPHAKAVKLKGLAVTSARCCTRLPGVPTIVESGYPGFEVVNWYGAPAPAGTPPRVIAWLADAMSKTVEAADVRERLIAAGMEAVESTPAEYAAFGRRDLAMWARMITEANIRAE